MKEKMFMVAGAVMVMTIVFGIMYGMRMFSNATTPITLKEVKPGVTCASMVTADGVAIDCWKE